MTQSEGGKRSINGLLIGGVAAVAIAGGLFAWKGLSAKDSAPPPAPVVVATKAKASVDTLANSFHVSGRAPIPADLPTIEEMLAKPVEGAPPTTVVPEEPVIQSEAAKVLADVERRAGENPEAAAAWVEKMPPGEVREEAVAFVHQQWAQKDPQKAAAWQERVNALAKEEE